MLYFLSILTAMMLVTAQALWKRASHLLLNIFDLKTLLTSVFKLILSWEFILGAVLYVVATLIYIWLFSRFPYSSVQLSLVSFSIILSLIVSALIFRESSNLLNYFGALIIILGVILATWKK